jgi:lipoate-protein ligase B
MPEEKLKECLLCRLGRITYPDAIALQQKLVQDRFEEKTGDVLLLLEHPPTITLGRFAKSENILIPPDKLAEKGIAIHTSNRGGDVTFHCPGQLLMHPIMDLRKRPGVLRGYIAALEEVALHVLSDYCIPAERWTEHPGLWVNGKQIGAIGLHFSHGISMHGLSLNVNPDLSAFEVINLCGLPGTVATSMANEMEKEISVEEVEQHMIDSFSDVFRVELEPISREQLEGECVEPEATRVV